MTYPAIQTYPTPPVPPQSGVPLVNAPAGMGVPVRGLSPIGLWAQLGGLTFGCVDQAGILWHFNDIEGWADGTAVAVAQQQRSAEHGSWVGSSWLEPRAIVFSGQVQAPSDALAWQARNVLLGVVASLTSLGVMDTDTQLVVNEPDAKKSAGVRPADKPTVPFADHNVFQFSIPLSAHDPRKYGTQQSISFGLPVAAAGLAFPVGPFGVTFGGTGTSGSQSCMNLGNFISAPVYQINGPCANPIITNATTGQQLAMNITLGSSDVLVIDTGVPSVLMGGTASRLNNVLPGSTFPQLVPGNNTIQFGASSYSSAAQLTVFWSSVWW